MQPLWCHTMSAARSFTRCRHARPRRILLAALLLVTASCGRSDPDSSSATSIPGTSTTEAREEPAPTAGPGPSTTGPVASSVPSSSSTVASGRACIEDLVAAWSSSRKIAQTLMVGTDPGSVSDARQLVVEDHVGGLFVGGNDTALLRSGELGAIVDADGVRPLVAVDEEGGRVQRIDAIAGSVPSARIMAETMSVDEVRALATERGRQMAELGVTVDFAPTVDVSSQGDREVIGDRSFSADPGVVTAYASAYADGLRASGILPVIKHFPGHGRATGDSHQGTSTTPPLESLDTDLDPFRHLITIGDTQAVMIGHLVVPGLTAGEPASLSPAAVDDLLRTQLGFDGLVFTDDLSGMRAVTDRYGAAEAVRRSLVAGVDMPLLVSTRPVGPIVERLAVLVGTDQLPTARLDEAVSRVLGAKGVPRCP